MLKVHDTHTSNNIHEQFPTTNTPNNTMKTKKTIPAPNSNQTMHSTQTNDTIDILEATPTHNTKHKWEFDQSCIKPYQG